MNKKVKYQLMMALLPSLVLGYFAIQSFTILPESNSGKADKIFINGLVLTIDSKNSVAQAVAVKDGKILEVGSTGSISKLRSENTEVIDLKGKTLIPGFIDGHSHFLSLGRFNSVNISSPPVGNVTKIADIISELKKFREERGIKDGEWIQAWGYDPDQLAEKRHPVKEDLDAAFPDNPVVLTHASGHLSVANSYALKISGVDSTTKDPAGGVIVRKPGTQEPTGLLQERAKGVLRTGRGERESVSFEEKLELLKEQQKLYASYGVTTAQDGATGAESIEFLKKAAERGELFIDIEALPSYAIIDKVINDPAYQLGILQNHLKLDGIKYMSDGSPQGKTAFFSKPYLVEVPGCDHDCNGFPTVTQAQFDEAVKKSFVHHLHFYVHCNGDSAIDMFISAVEKANRELKTTSVGRRTVVVHSQFVRPDQLDKYKELGITPTFFTNHTFFWGDTHVQNLGRERAYFSSPLKSALKKGISYTNHTDYGVTPINQLFLLWTSVNRKSRSGEIIGPDERVTPLEGLRALTINGAYQYFEENLKGSIEKGKLADLVILSDNPITVDPDKIKDITVLETIKEGKTIFKR
jgi:predicted amidohydrolase YtcJ